MAQQKTFDIGIIGGGPGGYVAAIKAAQLGMRVALVDRRTSLGGTCLNVGCIPSKALLSSSEHYFFIKHHGTEHGIQCSDISLNLETMMKRKTRVVEKLNQGVAQLMKHNKVEVFTGEGFIEKKGCIIVHREEEKNVSFNTDRIVLATGSVPAELPMLSFDGEQIIDSTDALSLTSIPEKLIVIGGGPIGLELGSVWSRLGAEVHVIEIMPDILPGWDRQICRGLRKSLSRQGLSFLLETNVTSVHKAPDGVTLETTGKDGKRSTIEGSVVLVAAGRKPYCPTPIIESLQLERNSRGSLSVNSRFMTSVDQVYALGDLIPGPMLAHKAEEEGVALAEQLRGKAGRVNYDAVPGVVYTAPEAAAVGKSEEQLEEEGVPYNRGTFSYRANGRALAAGTAEGFVKVLAHKKTDRILGVHILGEGASVMISEAVTVIEFGGSAEDIGRTVHAHPTLPEMIKEAALGAYEKSIHGM